MFPRGGRKARCGHAVGGGTCTAARCWRPRVNAVSRSALVIGAGVQGLTTGIVLAESGWPVRLRTALRPNETTSHAAGALWAPSSFGDTGPMARWAPRTYRELASLAGREDTGVRLVPARWPRPSSSATPSRRKLT